MIKNALIEDVFNICILARSVSNELMLLNYMKCD